MKPAIFEPRLIFKPWLKEWKNEKKREKGKNLEGISAKEGEKTVIKKRIRVKKELQQKIKIKRGERREKKEKKLKNILLKLSFELAKEVSLGWFYLIIKRLASSYRVSK